ncbi:MAG TPA: ABC transporter permease [Candidatus Nanoarchaeia archaeon]|nr:ABC transporter permease [Candidatus Nanoarchaeia archaeon]
MRLHRIQALLLKFWYQSVGDIGRMFDIFYWPVIGILFFGFTAKYVQHLSNDNGIILFILGGLMLWTLFQRVQQDVSVYLLDDFWSRNVSNTFITPITEGELFTAVSIVGVIRSLIGFAVMSLIGWIGYSFNIYSGGFMPFLFSIPLFLFAWALGIALIGMIYRYGTSIQVFAWSISFMLQPIAAMTYPITTLPIFMQKVALATPLYYSFEGFRQAFLGTFNMSFFIIATVLGFLYTGLGYWYFVRSIKKAKKTGLITNY